MIQAGAGLITPTTMFMAWQESGTAERSSLSAFLPYCSVLPALLLFPTFLPALPPTFLSFCLSFLPFCHPAILPDICPRPASGFEHQTDVADDHRLVDGLDHVVDGQRRHGDGRERFHLDAGLRRRAH